ncbi:MAG: hypothetical protein WB765_14070 [Acidimicrobiales bacterium]
MRSRWALVGFAASMALATLTAGSAAAVGTVPTAPQYPVGTAATGYLGELGAPTSSPPGVNLASCRPNVAHPYPVILLPGTL